MQLVLDDLVVPILFVSSWRTRSVRGGKGLTSKVISLGVLLYDGIIALDSRGCSTLDKEELFSCITFLNDVFSFDECPRLENVGNLCSFLRL
jgi:hypothetical protein